MFNPLTGQEGNADAPLPPKFTKMAYAPAEFDPTGVTKSLVALTLETDQDIDQQQTVSVNGRVLKRSRDSFGRGISSGGLGGLLETGAIEANTWFPTSSKSVTLTLDPAGFGGRFPDIQISSPRGILRVNEALRTYASEVDVRVGGRRFICGITCVSDLPALGAPKTQVRQLLVSRWHKQAGYDNLLITVAGDQQPGISSAATTDGVPSLQALTESGHPVWGAGTVALGSIGQFTFRLTCHASGSRLICDTPVGTGDPFLLDNALTLEVLDLDHVGGTGIRASYGLDSCAPGAGIGNPQTCFQPLVWRLGRPQWQTSGGLRLTLGLELINVDQAQSVRLIGGPSNATIISAQQCPPLQRGICSVNLSVDPRQFQSVTDLMLLQFGDADAPTAVLRYLRSNSAPLVTGIDDAQSVMTGQNLFFKRLQVGDGGPLLDLACAADGTQCRVPKYPASSQGFLYFLDEKTRCAGDACIPIQVVQLKTGSVSPIFHALPAAKVAGATAAIAPGMQIIINNQNHNYGKAMELTQ